MIDFNLWEITLIAVFAILIFGPDKLPEFARKAARIIAHLRRIGNDARSQLRAELGPEFDDINLSDLNPRSLVQKHLLSADEVEDFRAMRDEVASTGRMVTDTVGDATGKPASRSTASSAAVAAGAAAGAGASAGATAARSASGTGAGPPGGGATASGPASTAPGTPPPAASGGAQRAVPFDSEAT